MPWRTGVGRSGSIPLCAPESHLRPPLDMPCAACGAGGCGDREDHLGQHLPVPGGEAEPSVAGAFVVLPHRQRRTPQRLGFLALQRPALELLGQVRCDHLEDPTTQEPQRLRIVLGRQFDQMCLRGRTLLSRDSELAGAREPLQRRDDRAALRGVDPARSHRRGQDLMLLEVRCEPEVGAGLAAYLPRLDGDPVRCGAGTGVDGGLAPFGVGEQPQRQGVELGPALCEGDQGSSLVLGPHRHQRRIGQRVEARRPAVG